jgi:hypothetical protein
MGEAGAFADMDDDALHAFIAERAKAYLAVH